MSAHTKERGPGGRRLEMMRRRLGRTDEEAEARRERLGEHRRQAVEIIRDVLDDEQRARFDAHVERRRSRGRGRGPGRGRGHRGRGHGHGRGGWDDAGTVPAPDPTTDLDGPTDAV